jgi:hypothetical protein
VKVLHIANFGYRNHGEAFYNTDRKISAGFTENGHLVYEFSFRDMARLGTIWRTKKMGAGWANQEVIQVADRVEPDLILIGHSELLEVKTLRALKQRLPHTPIALWYVDALFDQHKTGFIFELSPYLDAVFATTGGEQLQQLGGQHLARAYFPNPVYGAVESLKNFEKNGFEYDFIFCGSVGGDPVREAFLTTVRDGLSDLSVRFCGAFGQPIVKGAAYIETLSHAKMGLNYSRRNDVCLYSSDRIAQLTGNGLLTFSPRIPQFDQVYRENELVYFDDVADLIEKAHFYQQHPEQAQMIAHAGWQRAHDVCATHVVTRFMQEVIFNQPLSQTYPWRDHMYRQGQ